MIEVLEGDAAAIFVEFKLNGEPFVPDADPSWHLRDHSGAILLAETDCPTLATSVTLTVSGANNGITSGFRFEKRTVVVSGTNDGVPFSQRVPYRIIPWLNHTVTPDAVRSFIGLETGELPDEAIDLTEAYYTLADIVGDDATLATGLEEGGSVEQALNKGIIGSAVLAVLPSLQARISKKDADGNRSVERFDIDFEKLTEMARRLQGEAVQSLSSTVINDTLPLIVFTSRTDPYTGV